MFSSAGYFRGVTCPYYASGLCERPYCHFRHVIPTTPASAARDSVLQRSDTLGSEAGVDDGVTSDLTAHGQSGSSSSLLNMVGQAIKQVQRDIERDKAALTTIKAPTGSSTAAVYKPTPIAASIKTKSVSASSGLYAKRTTVPEYDPLKPQGAASYNPTPIKLLNKQKEFQGSGLYVLGVSSHVNEDEYDPATNFSTKGKKQLKRQATYNGEDSDAKKSRPTNEDSDDDIGQPAFSDDDDNDDDTEGNTAKKDQSEHRTSGRKSEKVVTKDQELGVFTMDVDAILGVPSKETKPTDSKSKDKSGSHSKSQSSKSDSKSSSSKSSDSQRKSSASKSSHRSKSSSGKSSHSSKSSGSDKKRTDNQNSYANKETSGNDQTVTIGKEKKDKCADQAEPVKDGKKFEDRNIFSALVGDISENSNDSLVVFGSSNKENHKHDEDKSKAQSASDGSATQSHPKSSDKKEKSSSTKSSSSKSNSSHKSHSSSSNRHRHSSGSSSSSKHSQKASSSSSTSSSGHRSSSHSSSKSHHHSSSKSSSHSSKSSSHSSSSKNHKDHKSSRSHHHHSSKSSSSNKAKSGSSAKDDKGESKIQMERTYSQVDLFGEDSDDGSDDVMIVEPPKVDITVVELSSEDSDEENVPMIKNPPPTIKKEPEGMGHNAVVDDVGFMSDDSDDKEDDKESTGEEDLADLDESFTHEDTYDECLRIFNEEKSRTVKPQQQPRAKVPDPEEEEVAAAIGKKRVARITEQEAAMSRRAPPPKANARPSPSQVMHNRFLAIKKAAEEQVNESQGSKTREAHKATSSVIKSDQAVPKKHTPIASVAKNIGSQPAKRQAHVPSKAVVKRPTVPADYGSKVPTAVRQRYLNLFIDEALKIYKNEKDAFDRALEEEKVVYGRSSSKTVYLNVAVNCIKKIRSEIANGISTKTASPTKPSHRQFSHQALLGGKLAAKTSFTVKRSGPATKAPTTFTPVELFNLLGEYVLTPELLVDNGYPMMSDDTPGTAIIKFNERAMARKSKKADERSCVRCAKWFLLDKNGEYMYQEECVYHWGRLWKRKIGNSIENRYSCCQEDANAPGCCVSKGHVHEQNKYENLVGYMETMPRSPPVDGNFGVYALDCEMVYTTGGLDLARITVINHKLEPVYEQLVKPEKTIIDPNTRFSGLTEDDFVGVTSTIRDIQAVLLSMFSSQTILIGHSLESDLIALKLVHKTVVDTSVVFPHRLGPPYKRALRTLSSEILQKTIQESVGGHDSQEDANAAMELMLWKVKDEAKKGHRK